MLAILWVFQEPLQTRSFYACMHVPEGSVSSSIFDDLIRCRHLTGNQAQGVVYYEHPNVAYHKMVAESSTNKTLHEQL